MHEIRLYDQIGGYGITADEFTAGIPQDATEITVRINSLGGSVGDGLAMYHYLKDHPASVTTVVDGYAASMGSIVALAGDIRQVHKASMTMIHMPWGQAVGNADEMRETAAVLDIHADALIGIYVDATGMDEAEIRSMLSGETWMRGEAAVDYGFASELIEANDESNKQAAAHGAFASMVSALTEGRELMSKQKTRKELEAELVAKGEEVVAVEAKVEEVEAEAVAKVEEIKAEVEVVAVERDEIAARLETAEASVLEMRGMVDGIRAELDAAKVEAVEAQDEADKAKAALENPAVADAVLQDASKEAVAQVEVDADEAEAKAVQDAADELEAAPKSELEAWEAMDAGDERVAFWSAHKKVIFAQLAERNG